MIKTSNPPAYGTIDMHTTSSTNKNKRRPSTSDPYDVEGGSSHPHHHHVTHTMGRKCLSLARQNLLVILLVVALVLGVALGAGLRGLEPGLTSREQMYLRFPGEILMNMLQLLILPLIVSSLISGLTSLDTRSSGRLGARAVLYYLTTTLSAVVLGIILVLTIRPGDRGQAPDVPDGGFRKVEPADTFLDLKLTQLKLVEKNITQTQTENNGSLTGNLTQTQTQTQTETNASLMGNVTTVRQYEPVLQKSPGINMLGLVVFSISLGIAINRLGPKGRPLKDFVSALCEATLQLVSAVIWYASAGVLFLVAAQVMSVDDQYDVMSPGTHWYSPVGVLFLVAAQVVSMDDPEQTFEQLSFYFLTVLAGLSVHGFVVLPALYFVLVRRNPYSDRLRTMINVLGDAFGAGIVHHFSRADLLRMDEEDRQEREGEEESVDLSEGGEESGDLSDVITAQADGDKRVNGGVDNVAYDSSRM
ncbi:excitatory amino acid transporter 3-like [Aplysia californica]|uniref:Amino acid transporter n=1 Tax=Aplysia californica TaxID=6500 RepID=A0ABM0JZS8_APLCA|nr:excitatory amino acid transporter 3-like [Aplysia californica]